MWFDSVEENGSSNSGASSNAGAPTLTVRGPNGNTYFIQSMPDRVVREGIRINSVEATILTPNEDIATALASGTFLHFIDSTALV